MTNTNMDANHKSSFIAVVGRPSAGKSTLVNAMCGHKLAIVSPVPQTTRNAIRGIVTGTNYQLIFIDTPGMHNSEKKMNQRLAELSKQSLHQADTILYLIDSSRDVGAEENAIIKELVPFFYKTIFVINKIDIKKNYMPNINQFINDYVLENKDAIKIISVSAKLNEGLDKLLQLLIDAAPIGPQYYPPEYYTDQEPVFRISEIIREKVFLHTKDEIPHSVYVAHRSHHMQSNGALVYEGDLIVERESQKGIIIGAKASMIKRIRLEAEHDLKEIFGYPVILSIKVIVKPDWRKDEKTLKNLIT